jgi:hypothetical protein
MRIIVSVVVVVVVIMATTDDDIVVVVEPKTIGIQLEHHPVDNDWKPNLHFGPLVGNGVLLT